MSSFAVAQTFLVDPAVCLYASQVKITEVQVYFRAKPRIIGNKSGIYSPGAQVGIVPTQFGVPLIGQEGIDTQVEWARQEYGSIHVSADASMPTRFRFSIPQLVYTGLQYSLVVKFDGDEDFLIWSNKAGDNLVGTSSPSPGVSGRFFGKLYTYVGSTGATTGTGIGYSNSQLSSNSIIIPSVSSQSPMTIQLSQDFLLSTWKPVDSTDLKFNVSVARYFYGGTPIYSNTSITTNPAIVMWGAAPNTNVTVVSNNILRITAPAHPMEYISYDKTLSADSPLSFGDKIYQNQPYWSGGKPAAATVAVVDGNMFVTGNSSFILANGAGFAWTQLYANKSAESQWIVITSLNHDGAGAHRVNVRQVLAANGNLLSVAEPFTFTNAVANFFVAPVGRLSSKLRTYGAGGPGAPAGKMADIIVLSHTNANGTCRFVNNCIETYTITAPGTGYNNTDTLSINGFENVAAEVSGGYKASANIITNGSGVITALSFTNNGCGFVNTAWIAGANVVIANASGGTTAGTAATLTFTVGTTLKSEPTNGNTYFKGCSVINLDALQFLPLLDIINPAGTTQAITHRTLYHSNTTANTFTGKRYFVNDNATLTDFTVVNGKLHNFYANLVPSIVSRSNQFAIRFANGYVANADVIGKFNASNTAVYLIDAASNNDFSTITFGKTLFTSQYARYIINNDYTKEETNYGNAWAKHVTTKVNFADGRKAEDLLVYLTAYRPIGTDFKVYSRIINSLDSDTFDSKDWTLLEQTDGLGVYSSQTNPLDMKEFTYNFPSYPNTDYTFTGSVTTTLSSNVITGSNTLFTTNLAANDMVRIYQPLFPNNYMVGVVGAIGSNVSLTLTSPITNNGMVGSGLKMVRVAYPHQAFNDTLNSNVVAYYNSNMVRFDTYDTFQVKVVFLSNNDNVIPKFDDLRSVGVTA